MKRTLCAVAVILGLGLARTGDAQAQGLTLGAHAGYNYAQLSEVPTDLSTVGDKGSFVLGAFLHIQFHRTVFLGVEGNYVEYKNDLTEGAETRVINHNYIQLPAYLGARLMTGIIQPVVYAGAAASFETKCNIDVEGLEAVDCSDPLVGLDTKNLTWNGVVGGGLNIALPMIVLSADLRYNLGLSKAAEGEDTKWNSWMALVGVGIRLGS
jgi:hypothetical protein